MTDPMIRADEATTRYELARLQRRGELVRLRPGAYVRPGDHPEEGDQQHRQLVRATLPYTAPDSVISHGSAATMHRLPVLRGGVRQVHLTRDRRGGGRSGRYVHLHGGPLPPDEIVEIDGLPVTSLARTVLDLARTQSFRHAVISGDAALAGGLTPEQLDEVSARARRRPGMAAARRALAFLDGRSESPGESMSRVTLQDLGLKPTELQFPIVSENGADIARTDFAWPEHKTVAEFDGETKYGRLLRPGETAADVVFAEKRREDAIRDLGWQVVRWIWVDLAHPELIAQRLRRAFARTA